MFASAGSGYLAGSVRQKNGEYGPTLARFGRAFHPNRATVGCDDGLCDPETQPGPDLEYAFVLFET